MMITDELFMNNHTVLSTLSNQKSISQSIKQELFEKIMKAKDFIWCNYSSPLNITTIASEIGMSKYHFLRVFKTFTGLTPYQFLKSIRHQKACSFLTNNNLSIYEIADKTGFENASSFIKSFHKIEGIPPEKYRKK